MAAERSDSAAEEIASSPAVGRSRLVSAGPMGVAGPVPETALVSSARRSKPPPTYLARLRAELEELHLRYQLIMALDFMSSLSTAMVAVASADTSVRYGRFTGSCGAFTSRNVFLTAAHCVPRHEDLVVVPLAELGELRRVVDRAYHPSSDLALLRTSTPQHPGAEAALHNQLYLRYDVAELEDGGEFICAGFPAETSRSDGTQQPTARVVRGHFQRWFRYFDTDGRNYFALEMSCPAPAGLSGAVIAYTRVPNVAIGVVTANHDSYAVIDRIEAVEKDGNIYREQISRVVSYGIAAGLHGHEAWITNTLNAWTDEATAT